jgi:iron complex transport system ATP-binding protein
MTPLLEANGLSLAGRLELTDLKVGRGELVAVIGPNGGGKTSLLRALAGIERSSGIVCVDREELARVAPQRRPYLVTYVPASRDLVWPISVRDVIALGLPRPDPERVDQLIELFELEQHARRSVDRLSTGERARVLFARALAPRPKLLLLDEPLSNLDPYWVLTFLQVLRDAVSTGTAALVALHDINRLTAFDRALLIAGGAVRADLQHEAMMKSGEFLDAFRIRPGSAGWEVRPREDPRSSP